MSNCCRIQITGIRTLVEKNTPRNNGCKFSNAKDEKRKPMLSKVQVGKPSESVPGLIAIKCLESIDKKFLETFEGR